MTLRPFLKIAVSICLGLGAIGPGFAFLLQAQEKAAPPRRRHPAVEKDPFYLRRDPPLGQACPEVVKFPTVGDILAAMDKGTGLKITLHPSLQHLQDKKIGNVQGSGWKAWQFMELLANFPTFCLREPIWIPTPGGYQLCATGILARQEEKPKANPFYLRDDPRLEATVSVVGTNLTWDHLKKTVEEAAALQLTVDPKLGNYQPVFPFVQMRKGNAWAVMEMIARKDLEEGRWEKTPEGYQLTGKRSFAKAGGVSPPPKGSKNLPSKVLARSQGLGGKDPLASKDPTVNWALRQDPRLQVQTS